jgi:hypothetical protein
MTKCQQRILLFSFLLPKSFKEIIDSELHELPEVLEDKLE